MQISKHPTKPTAIWWIRRDLRLADNQALTAARDYAGEVVPVFILDPILWHSPNAAPKRLAFLLDGLRHLAISLQARGSRLIIREGNPACELQKLFQETGAQVVFAEEDYSPYARQRDQEVARLVHLRLLPGLTVYHPLQVVKNDNRPYTIFTPFSKTWKKQPFARETLPAPASIVTRTDLASSPFPEVNGLGMSQFCAGEDHAQKKLSAFVDEGLFPVFAYRAQRDRPDLNTTSGLSPYLRLGMLSARQVIHAAQQAIQRAPSPEARLSAETWLNELIWREFFQAILYHFPQVHRASFRVDLQGIHWANDPEDFQAWCEGRTGYPIVDAAMRQLAETGWMHNRARMIVASFLTKDLLIDWQWGARWFMQNLVDGDLAANNGGWQWAAGTGTDAAPYFRVFNPILQGQKFDPNGDYVRRWIPELNAAPTPFIHTPWKMSLDEQTRAGCLIGKQYPAPIIDHAWARERALQTYQTSKKNHA